MTGVEWCALLTQHLCTHGQILSLRGYHKSLYRALNGLVKFVNNNELIRSLCVGSHMGAIVLLGNHRVA